jgi:hypothetical protein
VKSVSFPLGSRTLKTLVDSLGVLGSGLTRSEALGIAGPEPSERCR